MLLYTSIREATMRLSRPTSINEALGLLEDHGEECTIISGGTAVMLMMRNGLLHPEHLMSLDRLPGLERITVDDGQVRLGARATLLDVERSAQAQAALPTLTSALTLVANHRVRRQATVGGNVSEADYASDPPSILVTFGSEVRLASVRGERSMPLADFLLDYYTNAAEPDELVVEVVVPRPSPTARTTYIKYLSRTSEDRPCVGVAAYVDTDVSGRCVDVRVAVAGATATPFTLPEVTGDVRGKPGDRTAWKEIAEAFRDGIRPISDVRGSAAYRKHVTGELVFRALENASTAGTDGATRL
jgi:carbon-monoxide dehydrogenase medium subunit